MTATQYYKHSGKIPIHSVLLGLSAGLVASAILAIAYAYADLYIPIVYLNILLCLGFGAGVSIVTAMAMHRGKLRNTPVAIALVMSLTLFAYYLCWVVWICAVVDRFSDEKRDFGWSELAAKPQVVSSLVQRINGLGT